MREIFYQRQWSEDGETWIPDQTTRELPPYPHLSLFHKYTRYVEYIYSDTERKGIEPIVIYHGELEKDGGKWQAVNQPRSPYTE